MLLAGTDRPKVAPGHSVPVGRPEEAHQDCLEALHGKTSKGKKRTTNRPRPATPHHTDRYAANSTRITAEGANHQRWYAGCPSLTATKVPRQVAVIFPSASREASTMARS